MTRPPKRKKGQSKRPSPGTLPKTSGPVTAEAKPEVQALQPTLPGPTVEPVRYSAADAPSGPQRVSGSPTGRAKEAPTPGGPTPSALPDEARLGPGRHSLEAMRLASALFRVQNLGGNRSEFRSAAEEAPFLLRSLGLGAGLATLAAKEGERQRFASLVAAWLLRDCPHTPLRTNDSPTVAAALAAITASDRTTYRAAQIEAMGYATSLKRMAQALCPKGDG